MIVRIMINKTVNRKKVTRILDSKRSTNIIQYRWINAIDYKGHKLNWIETIETIETDKVQKQKIKKFVYISSININKKYK